MILTGPDIRRSVAQGEITIDPYSDERLNPASYDLTLGAQVAVYSEVEGNFTSEDEACVRRARPAIDTVDSKYPQHLATARMDSDGFMVEPGWLYLMHTQERIHTEQFVPIIDGKSSIGRLGLLVHVTAGYGDPGFDGQYTLEVASIAHRVIVYPGMLFAQVRFHAHSESRSNRPVRQLYRGNYRNESSRGPVRSASWRQFVGKGKPPA